jgi:hypothetical protein
MSNCYIGWDRTKTNCGMTDDCFDCPILEPHPFDITYWSHKINGPALKYSVCRAIFSGYIVHWAGPEKPSVSDIGMYRDYLEDLLDEGECVEVDNGGGGENSAKTPKISKSRVDRKQKSAARAKQENMFAGAKAFHALVVPWKHSHVKHEYAFGAILVVQQLGLQNGTIAQYDIEYNVEYF